MYALYINQELHCSGIQEELIEDIIMILRAAAVRYYIRRLPSEY